MSALGKRLAVLEHHQRSALAAIVGRRDFPEGTPQADLAFLLAALWPALVRQGLDVEAPARPAWEHFLAAVDATTRADALNWLRALRTLRRREARGEVC